MVAQPAYNYKVIRQFSIILAPWLLYGRLRSLHTNAVIFAFGEQALALSTVTSTIPESGRAQPRLM